MINFLAIKISNACGTLFIFIMNEMCDENNYTSLISPNDPASSISSNDPTSPTSPFNTTTQSHEIHKIKIVQPSADVQEIINIMLALVLLITTGV